MQMYIYFNKSKIILRYNFIKLQCTHYNIDINFR